MGGLFVLGLFFSTLCLQVGNRLGFWGGFSCFFSFIWCQLFDWGGHFSFATSICGLLSFFATGICVWSLSFMAFSAVGIHVCLCLVSTFFRVSVSLSVFGIMLCACCSSASSLEIRTGFFCKSFTLWTAYKFLFEAYLIWYSAVKFTKLHSAKCSLHKWAWLRRSIKVSLFELYKFDSFSPHSGSIPRELVHSYALGCLWVVTVCCNTVGQHGRAFCQPHACTFN